MPCIRRQEWGPIGDGLGAMRQDVTSAQCQEYQQHADFNDDDEGIEIGRFLDADHQDHGYKCDTEKSEEVERRYCSLQRRRLNMFDRELLGDSRKPLPVSVVKDKLCAGSSRQHWTDANP